MPEKFWIRAYEKSYIVAQNNVLIPLRCFLLAKFLQNNSPRAFRKVKRDKPHVLFLMEKWCDGNPSRGLTNSFDNFCFSLEKSNLGSFSCIHYDEICKTGRFPDIEIFRRLMQEKPDFIVFSFLVGSYMNPLPDLLEAIARQLKLPIVMLVFDSAYENVMQITERYAPYVDIILTLDSGRYCNGYHFSATKFMHLWTPQNPEIWNNPSLKRDIDLSFTGSVTPYPDRLEAITYLRDKGVDIMVSGGQREGRLSPKEYADVFKRSRIVLNFPQTTKGQFQFKGRVVESILCGAVLLEQRNPETERWLVPMDEYIAYDGLDDMYAKLTYFLNNVDALQRIYNNISCKATKFSSTAFWTELISKVNSIEEYRS